MKCSYGGQNSWTVDGSVGEKQEDCQVNSVGGRYCCRKTILRFDGLFSGRSVKLV